MASSNSPPKKKLKQDSCTVTEGIADVPEDSENQEYKINLKESNKEVFQAAILRKSLSEKSCIEEEISVLKEESAKLEQKLELLSSECSEIDMEDILNRLHEYNDIRDATQILLGKLADFDESPISALYSRFGLNTTD